MGGKRDSRPQVWWEPEQWWLERWEASNRFDAAVKCMVPDPITNTTKAKAEQIKQTIIQTKPNQTKHKESLHQT